MGFTRKLAARARNNPEISSLACWLEGPYGGIPHALEKKCNDVILVAGGGGVIACLPWIERLAIRRAAGVEKRTIAVKFVWIVRRREHSSWVSESGEEVRNAMSDVGGFVRSLFYVTSGIDHTENSQEDIEAGGMTTIAHD